MRDDPCEGIEALIKPELLKWAREDANYSVAEAAQKADVREEALTKWEAGTSRPSIPQLRKLANVYRRPLAVFYLPEPPPRAEPVRVYRRLIRSHPKSRRVSEMTKEKQDRLRLNEKHLDDWRKRVAKMPLNLLAEALDVARDELSYQRDRVALIEAEVNRRAAEANADQLDAGAFLIVRQKGAIKHSYDYRFVPALLAAAEAAGENIAKLANQAIKPAEGYTIDKAKLNRLEKFGGEVAAIIRGMVVSERGADKFVLKPVAPAEGE